MPLGVHLALLAIHVIDLFGPVIGEASCVCASNRRYRELVLVMLVSIRYYLDAGNIALLRSRPVALLHRLAEGRNHENTTSLLL